MIKHTAGPWIDEGDIQDVVSVHGDLIEMREVTGGHEPGKHYTVGYIFDKANAHLIAASPELLEACKAIYQACGDTYGWPNLKMGKSKLSDMIENAIRKAEGRS